MIMISHFFSWQKFPQEMWPHFAAEFRDNGAEALVLTHSLTAKLLAEPDFDAFLCGFIRRSGLKFAGSHAPFGPGWDLNSITEENLDTLENLIRQLPRWGVDSCTIHIGLLQTSLEKARSSALRNLERLIPVAEKAGVVAAIENAEHPGGSVGELLWFRSRIDSAALGFCYDSGHAHVNGGAVEVLERLLSDVVVCHLHDNDGQHDLHRCPGNGTVPWNEIVPLLRKAPRMTHWQNEVNALASDISIRKLCGIFTAMEAGCAPVEECRSV